MTLLFSIFVCYMLVHLTNLSRIFARINWFERYQQWMRVPIEKWAARIEIRQFITVFLPLLILAWLLQWVSHARHYHWIYFVFSTVILFYGWTYRGRTMLMPSLSGECTRFIFSQALSRPFTVVFWFVILGPWGVLLYDFVRRSPLMMIKQILEWPAARILGLGYALAGHFPPAFSYWSLNVFKNIQQNQLFLEECGLYALNANLTEANAVACPKEIEEAKALVRRAEFMLVIILVILIMGGLLY